MENHYQSSYPDSRDSSPNSLQVDNENPSWDQPPLTTINKNYKVKLMCSYGGKIQFRTHDNQVGYIGGDTKILAIDRNIKFSAILENLSSICGAEVCFKYQLPGEDLDALISVTNDEDLEHMMVEYDRLYRASTAKSVRLRLFLFPLNNLAPTSFGSNNMKPEQQWFVDALNSVHIPHVKRSSPSAPVSAANPDFLFGLDKGYSGVPAAKLPHSAHAPSSTVLDVVAKDLSAGSEGGSEDRQDVGEPVVSAVEIQRQIQEIQRLHLGNNEQILQRESEGNGRVNTTDHYSKNPEKVGPPLALAPAHTAHRLESVAASAAVYLPERHVTGAGYSMAASATATEQPVYLIATPAVMYHTTTLRPVSGAVAQPYYGVPRIGPAADLYNGAPPAPLSHPKSRIEGYFETAGMVQPKVGVGVAEPGYAQVVYDSAGRQVYYATAAWGEVVPPYQEVALPGGTDGAQGGGALNQDGKVSK